MLKNKRLISALAGLALLPGLLAGCDNKPAETAAPGMPMLEVVAQQIEYSLPITGTGTMAPEKVSDIGPRVDGILDAVYARVGDRVKAGQPLFEIKSEPYRLALKEAESRLVQARASLEKAKRDLGRIDDLKSKGVASTAQQENLRTAYDLATAELGAATARAENARQNLADAVVTAPFDGVVTRRNYDEGVFLSSRMMGGGGSNMPQMGGAGGPVLQLMKIDLVAAIVQIPDVRLSAIATGAPVKLNIDGLEGTVDARVNVINDRIDEKSRTVEVRMAVLNPQYRIKPGLFVRAEIMPPPRQITVIERRALTGTATDRAVFKAENGIAKRVPVTVSDIDATRVEVLSGVNPGDKLLTGPNLARLVDGMAVRVEPTPGESAPAASAKTGG